MSDLNKALGKVLAKYRQAARHSQESLAFECNLHPTYISQLERGIKSPTVRVIFLLASALGVRPSKLLQETEEKVDVGGGAVCARRGSRRTP